MGPTTTISNGSPLYTGLVSNGTYIEKPKMKHFQVKVAIFNVTRDENYEIIDSTFAQELWVKQKNGVSLEAATMKQLGFVIDPDKEIIREILSITI